MSRREGERTRVPQPTRGKTPPLDPRIWRAPGDPEPFRRYSCIECGRKLPTWERFKEHRRKHAAGILDDPERPVLTGDEEEDAA